MSEEMQGYTLFLAQQSKANNTATSTRERTRGGNGPVTTLAPFIIETLQSIFFL